jgi:hypothetical protein
MMMYNIFKKPVYIIKLLMLLIISGCAKKSDPQPTLENSDYTGLPRILILSNSLNVSSVLGFGFAGSSYKFTLRAQSKEGLLVVGVDLLDYDGDIINTVSISSGTSSSGSSNSQTNFSNINITDYTGTFTLQIPVDTKDSIKVRAVLIDKAENREYSYFCIHIKKAPINLYFNLSNVVSDSLTILKVHANSSSYLYLMAESNTKPINITYECYKKSTGISLANFPKKSSFSDSHSLNGYYSDDISISTRDTGIYILKAYSVNTSGTSDTARITLISQPPIAISDYDVIGAQNHTLLGISYLLNSGTYSYKLLNKNPTSKSTFSYVYDSSTSYLISLFERKDANIYGDSLPVNTQHTRFIELSLPISSYDTISGNYIFSMIVQETAPEKISISTSKLIGYEDSDQNKGVVKINSIVVGSTGSVNFSTKYQYKLGAE